MVSIGERLKEERNRLGLNQEDFGSLAGVTKKTQGIYERGDRNPDAAYLSAVSDAGVDVLYVVTGQRTPRKEEGLDERERVVLDNFRSLPEEDRTAVHRLTNALKESVNRAGEKANKEAG